MNDAVICRTCRDHRDVRCPTCGKDMNRKLPKSHGKCPLCGNKFFLRPNQWLFDSSIVSREQKEQVDEVRRNFLALELHGLNEQEFFELTVEARHSGTGADQLVLRMKDVAYRKAAAGHPGEFNTLGADGVAAALHAAWYLQRNGDTRPLVATESTCVLVAIELHGQFGPPAKWGDIAWRVLNDKGLRTKSRNELSSNLLMKASLLDLEGKDSKELHQRWMLNEARGYKELGCSHVCILAGVGSCYAAKQMNKRRIPVDEFISCPPVPVLNCDGEAQSEGGPSACRCSIFAAPE